MGRRPLEQSVHQLYSCGQRVLTELFFGVLSAMVAAPALNFRPLTLEHEKLSISDPRRPARDAGGARAAGRAAGGAAGNAAGWFRRLGVHGLTGASRQPSAAVARVERRVALAAAAARLEHLRLPGGAAQREAVSAVAEWVVRVRHVRAQVLGRRPLLVVAARARRALADRAAAPVLLRDKRRQAGNIAAFNLRACGHGYLAEERGVR